MKKLIDKIRNFRIFNEKERTPYGHINDPVLRRYELKKSALNISLEEWVEDSKKILSQFILENPHRIEGFKFKRYYNTSEDPPFSYAEVIFNEFEKLDLKLKSPVLEDFCGGDKNPLYLSGKEGISPEWLAEIIVESGRTHVYSEFTNKKRNSFVKILKSYTGLDLKQEIKK